MGKFLVFVVVVATLVAVNKKEVNNEEKMQDKCLSCEIKKFRDEDTTQY
jgi:hypothetical protein